MEGQAAWVYCYLQHKSMRACGPVALWGKDLPVMQWVLLQFSDMPWESGWLALSWCPQVKQILHAAESLQVG